MKTTHKKVKVADLIAGFVDGGINGVKGFHGKLDIRPKYQREFVYTEEQQQAVVDTVMNSFPLNIMYWNDNGNGEFEVIDGQQRTLSICNYYTGGFGWDPGDSISLNFINLTDDKKEHFLNYELDVYVCEGTESEKLKWFETINIAGEPLTDQELRNAVFAGSFTRAAKDKFANPGGFPLTPDNSRLDGGDYTRYIKYTGSYEMFTKRQEFLELALGWVAKTKGQSITEYMGEHQHDDNANEMWKYFKSVIEWVQITFPEYHKDMQRKDWNKLYEANKDRTDLNPKKLQAEIDRLREDDDVRNSRGIYDYVLSDHSDKSERHLNIRAFDRRTRQTVYAKQKGNCLVCGEHFDIKDMDADHIKPWSKGGKTIDSNCQMLCKECNQQKSNK